MESTESSTSAPRRCGVNQTCNCITYTVSIEFDFHRVLHNKICTLNTFNGDTIYTILIYICVPQNGVTKQICELIYD